MFRDQVGAPARKAFGRGLREAREGVGLSQRQLERRASLDQTVISRLERGHPVRIRISTLFRLLQGLGISHVVLLTANHAAAAYATHGHQPGRGDRPAPAPAPEPAPAPAPDANHGHQPGREDWRDQEAQSGPPPAQSPS